MHSFNIVVDGADFNARAFHRTNGIAERDEIRTMKRMQGDVAIDLREYWSSECIEFELEDSCERLIELVSRLRPALMKLPPTVSVRAVLALGTQYGYVQGYCFSVEFLKALSGISCEIDIAISTYE